jgi:uncharacterized membrane protein
MAERKRQWGDANVETVIGNLLRAGVLLSAVVVLIGGIIYLLKWGMSQPHYTVFSMESAHLRHMRAIFGEAFSLRSTGIIQLGLLLLIFTPVARVAFSVFAFIAEKDWMYVVVTIIVLSVLLFSLFGGHSL